MTKHKTQSNRLVLLFAATLFVASPANAQNPTKDPTTPPSTQHPILTLTGKGVQIYECQLVASTPQWVFQAPDASLFDASGDKVGVHGAGPSWRYFDHSAVKGEVVAKSTPEPTAIPWLLLKAVNEDESGIMAKVEFIRRSDTHGGIAPATGCDTRHLKTTASIPYIAVYTFYSGKP